eukprot:Awhi_evm1s5000
MLPISIKREETNDSAPTATKPHPLSSKVVLAKSHSVGSVGNTGNTFNINKASPPCQNKPIAIPSSGGHQKIQPQQASTCNNNSNTNSNPANQLQLQRQQLKHLLHQTPQPLPTSSSTPSADPDPDSRPTHSYATLIARAILSDPRKCKGLSGIYEYISDTYPYYKKTAPLGRWQNSVRHNLSLNECFVKKIGEGESIHKKKAKWEIDPKCLHYFSVDGTYIKSNTGRKAYESLLRGGKDTTTGGATPVVDTLSYSKDGTCNFQKRVSPKHNTILKRKIRAGFDKFVHAGDNSVRPISSSSPTMKLGTSFVDQPVPVASKNECATNENNTNNNNHGNVLSWKFTQQSNPNKLAKSRLNSNSTPILQQNNPAAINTGKPIVWDINSNHYNNLLNSGSKKNENADIDPTSKSNILHTINSSLDSSKSKKKKIKSEKKPKLTKSKKSVSKADEFNKNHFDFNNCKVYAGAEGNSNSKLKRKNSISSLSSYSIDKTNNRSADLTFGRRNSVSTSPKFHQQLLLELLTDGNNTSNTSSFGNQFNMYNNINGGNFPIRKMSLQHDLGSTKVDHLACRKVNSLNAGVMSFSSNIHTNDIDIKLFGPLTATKAHSVNDFSNTDNFFDSQNLHQHSNLSSSLDTVSTLRNEFAMFDMKDRQRFENQLIHSPSPVHDNPMDDLLSADDLASLLLGVEVNSPPYTGYEMKTEQLFPDVSDNTWNASLSDFVSNPTFMDCGLGNQYEDWSKSLVA